MSRLNMKLPITDRSTVFKPVIKWRTTKHNHCVYDKKTNSVYFKYCSLTPSTKGIFADLVLTKKFFLNCDEFLDLIF